MNPINGIFPLLTAEKSIIIIPHKNPDADAIGSTLALFNFFKKIGLNATVVSPNLFPKFLNWLPNADKIIIAENNIDSTSEIIKKADIIFCLDFNTLSRIDILENCVKESTAIKVLIDHHQEPSEFDFLYSDTEIPATSQLVYHFIELMDKEDLIDKEIATCIYAGIISDTGSFRFSSVKPSTHKIVAKLLKKGISHSTIHDNLYDNNTIDKLKLLARTIDLMDELKEFRTCIIHLNKDDLLKFNYQKGDTEGFVNYGLMLENCVFSVALFEDLHKNLVKISFRSKGNFDVNAFARKHFDGGGHINAAGGISKENMVDTIQKLKNILVNYKSLLLEV